MPFARSVSFFDDILEAKKTFGERDEFVLKRVYQNSILYSLNQIGEFFFEEPI